MLTEAGFRLPNQQGQRGFRLLSRGMSDTAETRRPGVVSARTASIISRVFVSLNARVRAREGSP